MALQANELRIGNTIKRSQSDYWIGSFKGQFIEVTIDELIYLDLYPTNDRYEPILLTPEVLSKCEIGVFYDDSSYMLDEVRIEHGKYWYVLGCVENDHGCWEYVEREINYLHELQNIYFASTKTELSITL